MCVYQSVGRKLRDGGEKEKTGTNILSFVANCNDYKEVTLIHIQNIFYFQIHSICIFLKIYIYICVCSMEMDSTAAIKLNNSVSISDVCLTVRSN